MNRPDSLAAGLLIPGLVLSGLLLPARNLNGADWPQFLGPNRNGISAETDLIDRFGEDGPVEVWRISPGVGMSGFAIVGGTAYTLTQNDDAQFALALDAETGDERWRTPLAPPYANSMGDGPRASPAVRGNRLFTFTGEGVLSAVSTRNGEVLWSHDTVEELGGKPAIYGMASSPLLVGDAVVVSVGAPQATVAAYAQQTGDLLWTAGTGSAAGYSSPALISIGGQQQLVAFVGSGVLGIDPEDGDVLWQYEFETDYECNIATPVAVGENVFISAGESHGCALLSIAKSGDGATVDEVWTSLGPRGIMRNQWQTSIYLDGFLYGFDNVGASGPITHLACINAATGEAAWKQLRFGKGNMIAADGKLWISNKDGELVIVRATPEGFEELDRAQVLTTTRQAPVLVGGRLYLRGDEETVCIDVSDQGS